MAAETDYTIISRPSQVFFECPHCKEDIYLDFTDVYFKSDYWGDGAWCDCPKCGEKVELGDYEYD